MMKLLRHTIFFVLLLVTGIIAQDEKPLIEVTSAVDTSRITIGDRITYSISIDYADSLRVERPGEGINLGRFEIKDYRIYDPLEDDNRINQKFEYVISVFDTGTFVIPPFPVAYFASDSAGDYRIIEASAITIYVESVLEGEDRQLRDIKPPIDIPYDYVLLGSFILAVILILVIIYLGYRLYRKRKESGYLLRPPQPPRPAHEVALVSIDHLLAKDLIKKGAVKQFYIEISEIIRVYIEGRYYIRALEETSSEIITELNKLDLPEEIFQVAREALSLADLVKFAKYQPSDEENQQIVHWVRSFIEATKLVFNETAEKDEQTVNQSQTAMDQVVSE